MSYVLISSIRYEGKWIEGVVHSLEEASEYFLKKVKKNNLPTKDPEELVYRALADNWEDDYVSYWVELWDKTQKICTYKYNSKTCLLEKYSQKQLTTDPESDQK